MIEFRDLKKSYGDHVVLDEINLQIGQREIFGLVGVSGAGKSTLLRCINRLEKIDSGSLVVDGTDVGAIGDRDLPRFRRRIGMVFQQFSLMERKNVYDNVYFPLKCQGVRRSVADRKVRDLLDLVGLGDKLKALPRELSGGQKQRVAIARALVNDPMILLCDEATSALDPNITEAVLDLLKRINGELGLTIVVVTHEVAVMKSVCTRMGLLSGGHLRAEGTVEHFFLENPELLGDFTRDAGRRPEVAPGTSLVRVVQRDAAGTSLLSQLAIRTGVPFEISWGGLDRYRDRVSGSFLLQVADADLRAVCDGLTALGADWKEI
ncbi:methionine ABC transporter ATP-binding protein [Micromonospora sagamiensis]|uniref:methionine ABC transporter ATP-binding protein n=1 Tax=Micromonospora sagamiensis TaxID=47875 RepID=UPI0011A210C8|nr:methionine ABC transporter ATP-binding protein [Micromonospora sagamiensis]BCL12495.1 D-methionine ABC transporter ATP-binding protein [Micromonospora sagamiensis]